MRCPLCRDVREARDADCDVSCVEICEGEELGR